MAGPEASVAEAAQTSASQNLVEVSRDLVDKASHGGLSSTMPVAMGLMVLAFMAHVLVELKKTSSGSKPDFGRAIAVLAVHVLLLTSYATFTDFLLTIAAGVTHGGQIDATAQVTTQATRLTQRFDRFQKEERARRAAESTALAAGHDDSRLEKLRATVSDQLQGVDETLGVFGPGSLLLESPGELADRFLERAAEMLMALIFVFTSAMILLLSVVQKAALVLLVSTGPIIIVLSAFPGPTSGFLFSWILAVLEVSMWGFTTRVLGALLSARFDDVPTNIVSGPAAVGDGLSAFFENMAFCFLTASAYAMVPVLTAALFRGGGIASVAGQMASTATSAAMGVATGRALGAHGHGLAGSGNSGSGSGTGSGAGSGAAGSTITGAAGRAGDEGAAVTARAPLTRGQAIAKHRAIHGTNTTRAE